MRRNAAINYMLTIAEDHYDGIDVNLTRLAEECAAHFGEDEIGGPLDDPDHPVWDWAIIAAERFTTSKTGDHDE
ncbi:MAG: hypothetical protein GY842_14815 [bacterium]|nr:hypothetical protein [bacterium]